MGQQFMRVEEVAEILDVSTSYAYKVIRELNEELKRKGFITISGRVNREYFNERLYQARKLLRKVFGHKQIDNLLDSAKSEKQSKQREKRFRNYKDER